MAVIFTRVYLFSSQSTFSSSKVLGGDRLGIVELYAKILQIMRNDFKDYARTFCQLCAPFSVLYYRCQILRLKCTKFNFGWGSAPNPGGAYSAFPDPLAGFKGTYF